jgi:hypothetical protein
MANAASSSRWLPLTRSPEPAIALLIFLAALAYFKSTLHLTLELRDEGFLLYNIARVAHGEIPHRDFIEVYGPGVYAVTAPIFQIFGDRVLPIRELLAVFRAAAVVLSYLIARHLVPRPFALLGAFVAAAYWGRVIWSLNTPYATLFTIPLCMLSLALLLHGQSRGSRSAYVWSGIVCGAALTFKWSLAAMSAYGMVLAICASAMLREPSPPGPRTHRSLVLFAWALAGVAIVVPFRSTLAPFDYLLHLAPIHALLALIGVRFARFGDGGSAFARAAPLVARYCAGFLVFPALVAAFYLSWDSFGDLLYNTVYRPLHYRDYYKPIRVPPLDSILFLLCIIAWVTSALAFLRRSRRVAISLAALGALLAPAGFRAIEARGNVSLALEYLILQLPAITAFVTLALLATPLARSRPLESGPLLHGLIAAIFFQEMMSFQIFPRGAYNVILMLGTLAPLFAYLSYRWYALANLGDAPGTFLRRSVAFVLAASLPAIIVSENVRTAISAPRPSELAHTALRPPALAGIRPKPEAYERQDLSAFDALIARLERAKPAGAPIFAIQNEPMIYFLSGREPLFEDHALILFLAGWGLLPENDRDAPPQSVLIQRLERTPEAIIVVRQDDKTTRNFIKFFPQVARFIGENYRVEHRIGDYRILRRIEAM